MDLATFYQTQLTLIPAFLFVLFLHGAMLVLHALPSLNAKPILANYSAITLLAFFVSLMVNLFLFVSLSLLDISIWNIPRILILIDFSLIGGLLIRRKKILFELRRIPIHHAEKGLYLLASVMGAIMLRNGGLIDILADSWWHMSLVSRILEDASIFSVQQHLIGYPTEAYQFDYPFLWHATLALISQISNVAVPVIWHTIAAVVVLISLLSFYLFSFALTRDRWIALLATGLFCILYGGLNSYFRVSPWPGNISYIGMYFSFYLYFLYLHNSTPAQNIKQAIQTEWPYIAMFLVVTICMASIHGVALILFLISIALFLYGSLLFSLLQPDFLKLIKINNQLIILIPILIGGMVMGLLLFPEYIFGIYERFSSSKVLIFIGFLISPVITMLVLNKLKATTSFLLRLLALLFWITIFLKYYIDYSHLYELFVPSEVTRGLQYPKVVHIGDIQALLPNWAHQLRGSLLFSGLLSIPVSIIILWLRRDTASLFLSTNACIAACSLTSPLLFWVITAAIQSTSSYRVHLLIFHPIIFALAIATLLKIIRKHV